MKNDVLYFPFFAGNQPSSLTGGTSGGSDSPSSSEGFVVQRGRTVPTLTNIDSKSDKEQHNKDTKSEELGETSGGEKDVFQQMKNIPVAGRPSETNVTPRRPREQGLTAPAAAHASTLRCSPNACCLVRTGIGGGSPWPHAR